MTGEELSEFIFGICTGQFFEDNIEVFQVVEAVGLGRFDKGVDSGAGLCTGGRAGEEPVFAAHGKGTDGVFGGVVVRGQVGVVEVSFDPGPLDQGVANGLTEKAFGWDGRFPIKENILDLFQPQGPDFIGRQLEVDPYHWTT